jgi:hypothetical protein
MDYSGATSSSQTPINSAIAALTNGGVIFVKAGTYTLSAKITDGPGVNDIIFEGQGRASLFLLGNSFTSDAFQISGSNWVFRDFELDGQLNQGTSNKLSGIVTTGNNETFTGLYILRTDTCGIKPEGNQSIVEGNFISGQPNDNLCFNTAYATHRDYTNRFGATIANNILDDHLGTKNCLSIDGISNVSVTGNTCWVGTGHGIGLEQPSGEGTNLHVTITGNTIISTHGDGIDVYASVSGIESADYITITGDTIDLPSSSSAGIPIDVHSGAFIDIVGNLLNGGLDGLVIRGDSTTHDISIKDNTVRDPYYQGIVLLSGTGRMSVVGNSLYSVGSGSYAIYTYVTGTLIEGNQIGIVDSSNGIRARGNGGNANDVSIIGNHITGRISTSGNAIDIYGGSRGLIEDNYINGTVNGIVLERGVYRFTVMGNFLSNLGSGIYGIYEKSGDYNYITNNYFTGTIGSKVVVKGNHTLVTGNIGYNPIGKVTSFIYAGGTAAGDGTYISPQGTSSTVVASTTYTMTTAPCLIVITAVGTAETISIEGGAPFTAAVGQTFYLTPGETINFGAFTGNPTEQVIFS